jgi:NitT/TauT family transport system substrate-binding protein
LKLSATLANRPGGFFLGEYSGGVMRRFCFAIAGIFLVVMLLSCSNPAVPDKIRIGIIKPSIDHLPLALALKKGYLDKDKFELTQFTSGWETQEAIISGRIDLAIMPFTYAWTAVEKGYDLKIISCLERETDGILTSNKITSLKDLDKKKVGLLRASTLEILMQDMARFNSFTYQPVYFRSPSELVSALQGGDVDAIVCYVPIIQKMGTDFHVLHWFAETYPGHPCCDLVTSGHLSDRHAGKIKALKSALQKAADDISKPTASAFKLLSETYGLDELQSIDALKHTVFNVSLTEADMMFERQMMESFLESGYVKKLPTNEELYAR